MSDKMVPCRHTSECYQINAIYRIDLFLMNLTDNLERTFKNVVLLDPLKLLVYVN